MHLFSGHFQVARSPSPFGKAPQDDLLLPPTPTTAPHLLLLPSPADLWRVILNSEMFCDDLL